ncbi:unnamed protein product [Penicillium salamii]|uniref:Lariat debranching enzyme C-terminal domain-containing protein n=1 Tax=Penicillium salamii TaxID=1612424 RepID=A0A9W4IP88_9EURO|nr:unnamed protein product [Penicillium salamii]CAG8134099.1 unnamed protein product [Penicillium salamii]CAG8258670.1 unnamed protein product [Penicillium salamii]CAG8312658.1 unnamed protein product [Penicillium salamii]CAG8320149.1 unnamed protein product [Penicillium salamii]
MMAPMRIALEGCVSFLFMISGHPQLLVWLLTYSIQGHGSLNVIYDAVKVKADQLNWTSVDVLIIGGDFQALRNSNDATCVSMPAKYRQIGDFHEYYSGKRVAPYLTIFLGGNHEASNYLSELYYGGWVAPNIYYLGAANIIRLGSLRISGISGIWKGYDYRKPHFERLPYNESDVQSIYHVRELDVRKLLQVRTQVDIGLSHDWPQGVEKHGDYITLFKKKRGFEQDSHTGRLGSTPARELLDHLRPPLWFSAHLHVRFTAFLRHDGSSTPTKQQALANHAPRSLTSSTKISLPDEHNKAICPNEEGPMTAGQRKLGVATGDVAARIAAWQGFGKVAHRKEMADEAEFMAAFKQRQATGAKLGQPFTFEETVRIGKGPIQTFVLGPDGERVETTGISSSTQNSVSASETTAEKFANADKVSLGSSPASSTGARLESATETPSNAKSSMEQDSNVANNDQISLGSSSKSSPQSVASSAPLDHSSLALAQLDGAPFSKELVDEKDNLVEDDLDDLVAVAKNELPASLERSPTPVAVSKVLPAPEEITNKLTKFLTLDKPKNHDPFVELVEFGPVSQGETEQQRPFRLQYDKEWLAITRVFAEELDFGNVDASVPHHKGYEYYQRRIAEEEVWVQEHVVDAGLLNVPEDFARTAPVYDPSVIITTDEQPVEYTNPQTEAFCRLVGIENKFDLPDEERRARVEAGPRPCDPRTRKTRGRGSRGGRGRGGRGRGRGRGGHSKSGNWNQGGGQGGLATW